MFFGTLYAFGSNDPALLAQEQPVCATMLDLRRNTALSQENADCTEQRTIWQWTRSALGNALFSRAEPRTNRANIFMHCLARARPKQTTNEPNICTKNQKNTANDMTPSENISRSGVICGSTFQINSFIAVFLSLTLSVSFSDSTSGSPSVMSVLVLVPVSTLSGPFFFL